MALQMPFLKPREKELYERNAIPAPGRQLFQAATAMFNPFSQTKVNTKKPREDRSYYSRRKR